jgi:competence protein ComEC
MAAWVEMARRHSRHVVLFWAAAGLLLGPVSPAAVLVAAVVAAALAGRVPLALAAVAAVLAGGALAQARVDALGPGRLPELTGERIVGRATLLEPIRRWRSGTAVARVRLLRDVRMDPGGPEGPRGGLDLGGEVAVVRAAHGEPPVGARVGSELLVRGTVAPLADFEDYQRRRGAHAAIEVSSWTGTGRARGGLAGTLDAARERARRGLGAALAEPQAALLRGMVLGQDEAIDDATKVDFQRSGLAHLLAVSGQNVLLLCTLVLAGGALAGVPLPWRLVAALVLVAVYVPLAGAGPSIQRAGVMGVAGLVAALAGRPSARWYALGLAAAVTLALNPHAVGEPGWQLSFAAVAGLLALVPGLREALARRRLPGPVADMTAITVAATAATAPLMALHFEQVSLISLPANLVAAIVVAPIMWLGMVAIALAQLAPGLAAPLNVLCAPLLGYLGWVAHVTASLPMAAAPIRLGGVAGLAGAYAALAVTVLAAIRLRRRLAWPARLRARSHRRGRFALAAGALAVILVAGVLAGVTGRGGEGSPPAPGELVVSFLDVGQGDATLLQRGPASVLVDTGPPGGPILRRLEDAGVNQLDLLVLTHAESDHEGMALPVIAAHRPRLVLDGGAGWPSAVQRGLPAALERVGGRSVAARAGQTLRVGELRMEVLWPPSRAVSWRPDGNPNDHALVAVVRDGPFDLLLPADAETNVTAGLDLPRVEALKVAHHGSADEGLPALLERTSPLVAAIEVGEDNTYGHPAPSTLDALRTVPQVVRTDRDGTVRLHVAAGRMRLERGT